MSNANNHPESELVIPADGDAPAPSSLNGLVRAFFHGKSATTIAAYQADLTDFGLFVQADSIAAAARLLVNEGSAAANLTVLSYRADLLQRGLSPATVNRRLAAIRSLLKLAKLLGFVAWDLVAKNAKSTSYRDTRGPCVTDVRRLLAIVAKRKDRKGVRDFALLRLLYDLALRRNEAVTLDVEHVDPHRGLVHVLRKGYVERKPMTLPLPTIEALKAWLAVRGGDAGPLFMNVDHARKGSRLTGVSVNRIVTALGARLGLKLTAHQLRHAAITHALDATNGDVRAVARFSGHKQIQTLLVYDDNRTDMAAQIARSIAASADPALSLY